METRTLYALDELDQEGYATLPITFQAIPWCITHNGEAQTPTNAGSGYTPGLCFNTYKEAGCEISTGGPEHRWWRDVD